LVEVVGGFSYNPPRVDEICGAHNGRKLYLELGDRGSVRASFVDEAPLLAGGAAAARASSHSQCNLEIVTCPSCVITATFKFINLSSCSLDSACRSFPQNFSLPTFCIWG